MNQEVKRKWLDALRSGEYEQGQERLRRNDKFCCLGVLCDLHSKETGNKWEQGVLDYSYLGDRESLPLAVAKWAEFDGNSQIDDRTGYISLIDMNDSDVSFAAIADVIEDQL